MRATSGDTSVAEVGVIIIRQHLDLGGARRRAFFDVMLKILLVGARLHDKTEKPGRVDDGEPSPLPRRRVFAPHVVQIRASFAHFCGSLRGDPRW